MLSSLKITLDPWTILLLFSALLGIYLTIIFTLNPRGNKKAISILSILLIVIVLLITEYLLFSSGLHRSLQIPIFISTPLIFLIGPLYYLYSSFLLGKEKKFRRMLLLHFIPFFVCLINYLDYYITLIAFHLSNHRREFNFPLNLNGYHYMALEILQTGIYVLLVYKLIRKSELNAKNLLSGTELLKLIWLKRLNVVFIIYLVLKLASLIYLIEFKYIIEVEYILALTLSLIIYMIGYGSINLPEIFSSPFEEMDSPKYMKSTLNQEQITVIKHKLLNAVENQNIYLQADLKLHELAKLIGVSTNHLSQFLNQELKTNFFDFINSYRVEEAKKRLSNPNYKNHTILAIAYDSGFANKTTFNRIFKKYTGITPSLFVKSGSSSQSH